MKVNVYENMEVNANMIVNMVNENGKCLCTWANGNTKNVFNIWNVILNLNEYVNMNVSLIVKSKCERER